MNLETNLETNKHLQFFSLNEFLRRYNAPKLTKITKSEIEVPLLKYDFTAKNDGDNFPNSPKIAILN